MMIKKTLGGAIIASMVSFLLQASIDCDSVKKQAVENFNAEYAVCRSQLKCFKNYIKDCSLQITYLPDAAYYNALQHMCDVDDLFEDYQRERIDIINTLGKASKKLFGAPSQDEISKQKKEALFLLQNHKAKVETVQKAYRYCGECKKKSFIDYNQDNKLVSGYRHLAEISQMSEVLQGKNDSQLSGQLSQTQKHYVNLLHWMHHRLESEGVYQYVKGLKPVSFGYNGAHIRVEEWNVLHICMGDIKNGRLGGVHNENKDLFSHFYERKQNHVMVRSDNKLNKYSTFFPYGWDMQKCVKKAYESLQNISMIEPGDQHGPGNIIVHGVTPDYEKIITVVDPTKKLVVSFYPEK